MKRIIRHIIILSLITITLNAQKKISVDLDGQVSLFSSYIPNNDYVLQSGIRYIPEINALYKIDSSQKIDAQLSLNTFISNQFSNKEDVLWDQGLSPYRAWVRYAHAQWEVRGGLQKIDFGSASALRPLQWFNQIDPRDPLQITNGVWGLLGRYYFLNNANLWIWSLYGNEGRRGLDLFENKSKRPEIGGRFQFEIPKGELAFTYHNHYVQKGSFLAESTTENKFGIDAKWDIEVGLWVEASYSILSAVKHPYKNQFLATMGIDYTFGLGNGLNAAVEHMSISFDENAFEMDAPGHFTASIISYPFSMYDNLSSIVYYNWDSEDWSFFLNYQHSFPSITAYFMAFYIPEGQNGFQQSTWTSSLSGPGFRIMLVYNH